MLGHDFWCNQPGVMDAVHDRFQDKFTVLRDTRIWSFGSNTDSTASLNR